jgi:hypothetical protein
MESTGTRTEDRSVFDNLSSTAMKQEPFPTFPTHLPQVYPEKAMLLFSLSLLGLVALDLGNPELEQELGEAIPLNEHF